ncbi:hypothetical protein [Microbacterium sp. SS28]|uniref:hypothetical protein n=1 Tax=Microbacterium sp. SS28 TaxID=2919948 RepID=UPI001FA95D1A|nr:hypothetical protein [Microbacterium sp. SS28]
MDQLASWSEFNIAMAGAAAALAGLVIVAASVNITQVVKARSVTARLAAGIATLVLAITASGLGLVPEISMAWYGAVLTVATLVAAVFQVHAARVVFGDRDHRNRQRFLKGSVGGLPLLAYLAAGVLVLVGHPAGLVFAAVGCLAAIATAIIISWVALVEVLR